MYVFTCPKGHKSHSASEEQHDMSCPTCGEPTQRVGTNDIEWGYNCLTSGVHHGRPEAIWNIPLLHAARIFRAHTLKGLVIARIYNDAAQIVDHNEMFDDAWAGRVREIAEERYDSAFRQKVGELVNYYKTPGWERDQEDAVRRVIENKLNPGYEPLHGHDSINMLCRILGTNASRRASSERQQ